LMLRFSDGRAYYQYTVCMQAKQEA
jgi:hypothetical protein